MEPCIYTKERNEQFVTLLLFISCPFFSSEQARKKKECVSMSEAEKKLNKQIFERAGIFPRDTIQ
jgi:hypothetical protein